MSDRRHYGLSSRPPAREPLADDPLTLGEMLWLIFGTAVFVVALAGLLGSVLPWAYVMFLWR